MRSHRMIIVGTPVSELLAAALVRVAPKLIKSRTRKYPTNKNDHPKGWSFLLSMGYEKDIFGSFAYDFELSQF